MHTVGCGRASLWEWQTPDRSENLGENSVNASKHRIATLGLLSVLCAIPSMAQITNQVTFDVPSAFYAGNAKLPAGSYTVSQPDVDSNLLLIEDANGSHSVFVEDEIHSSDTPHAQTDVPFNKYGNLDFLNAIRVQGRNSEMQILPSKRGQNSAKASAAEKHSLSAKNAG
jgi:hypothetical protein